MRSLRLTALLLSFALLAASCGGNGGGASASGSAPECVTNATVLAQRTQEGFTLRPGDGGRVRLGAVAPDFVLCDADGKLVQLSAYEGRPVLLVFWASWCPYCLVELPTIDAVLKNLPADLVVITVSMLEDQQDSWNTYRERGYTFTNVFDTAGTVTRDYDVRGVPRAIFIDGNGVVAGQIIGEAHFDKPACFDQLVRFARGETSSIVTAYCRK